MSSMERDPEQATALRADARALTDDKAAPHPRQRYEAAAAAANAEFRPKWVAAQKLPTLAEQSNAAYAAERERIEAVQAAASQPASQPARPPSPRPTVSQDVQCLPVQSLMAAG